MGYAIFSSVLDRIVCSKRLFEVLWMGQCKDPKHSKSPSIERFVVKRAPEIDNFYRCIFDDVVLSRRQPSYAVMVDYPCVVISEPTKD